MFNLCEVFVGRAMVTDAGRANTCRRKFKAPWLQTIVQKNKKNEGPSGNEFHEKTVWAFQTKKINRLLA